MVRAFSTLGCPDADLRNAVALAERFGLDAIELRALGETINLPAYLASEYGSPEAFAEAAGQFRIKIISLDTSLHLAEAKAAEREQFLAFLPWAEAAGVRWLRVFDGGAKLSERGALAAAAETVAWWRDVRAANGYQADIMVETHNRFFSVPTLQRFLAVAPGTALLWDAHNTWKMGHEDPVTTWRGVHRHIVHVHLKDSISVPTKTHPYKFVLPGTGEFPMAAVRAAMQADGFAGTQSLEWEKLWHPDLPSLETALRAAQEHHWW
ncbi:TIM barrel protein [Opitutus sp. ER46]|uniref:sugar phosphate isomerase/epimerase family protein n=1 Tax=Opitutus sp. ER46 TaxID=2161864 RepID=UPI000D2FA3D0|nr:TIM barrel protein [Opitutus sp. ER46]PTX95585.1 sugar phosphate isomerase/epimerase [Opitutus sp. ER46]